MPSAAGAQFEASGVKRVLTFRVTVARCAMLVFGLRSATQSSSLCWQVGRILRGCVFGAGRPAFVSARQPGHH
eukprot:1800192-Lingulodinium_polyedra.AAC.1